MASRKLSQPSIPEYPTEPLPFWLGPHKMLGKPAPDIVFTVVSVIHVTLDSTILDWRSRGTVSRNGQPHLCGRARISLVGPTRFSSYVELALPNFGPYKDMLNRGVFDALIGIDLLDPEKFRVLMRLRQSASDKAMQRRAGSHNVVTFPRHIGSKADRTKP